MMDRYTFSQRILLGFAVLVLFCATVGWIGWSGIRGISSAKDHIIEGPARALVLTQELNFLAADKVVQARGYAVARQESLLQDAARARTEFLAARDRLARLTEDPEARRLLDEVTQAELAHKTAWDQVVERVKAGAPSSEIAALFTGLTRPRQLALSAALDRLTQHEERALERAQAEANARAERIAAMTLGLVLGVLALAVLLAWSLTRLLSRQIGSAVQHVQSSASELQATAGEQASGSKEQASAVNEIATTIKELLSTSRQIAESAQRVAQITEETVNAAREGDQTVSRGQEAIAGIRRQTDQVVSQVLDLGRRSQQIGGVVDIITELAEQTNILAINATIEAAGAGEAGRRFSVVADEIRKLADRVGSSAKDIQGIVDQIRDSVNTTVMATEGGAKAVEGGTRVFGEIAQALRDIVDSVTTATQAAREIELSTKQQTTAVEQVSAAINNVAQAVHELEAGSSQTLQTSAQLAELSTRLSGLVRSERKAA